MITITADDKIPFLRDVLETKNAKVTYLPGGNIKKDNAKNSDALIIRTRTKCDKKLLDNTKVRFIASATIGHDHIDAEYCKKNDIQWTNAPGCNSSSVQQYMTAALLHIAKEKKIDLSQKTIGIVGVGNVGKKVAHIAKLLNMKVLLNDPPRQRKEKTGCFVPLSEVVQHADVITFHVPLNKTGIDKTRHLANNALIEKMKNGVIICNTSRGEVVETNALKNAIKCKKVSAAIVDVWENEPEIDTDLMQMTDLATPHIAGYSADGKANGTSMSVQAISRRFGLGLDDWFPEQLPQPTQAEITIDCRNKNKQQIMHEAIIHTYPIAEDDRILRASPETFEAQRGNYRIRREFQAYSLHLLYAKPETKQMLIKLGFTVKK